MNVRGLTIGDNVHVNFGANWICDGGLAIGDNVHFGPNSTIYTRNHNTRGTALPYDTENIARAEAPQRALEAAFAEAKRQLKPAGKVAEARLQRARRSLDLSELCKEAGDLAPLTLDVWSFGPIRIRAVSAEVALDDARIAGGDDPLAYSAGCAGQVFGYIPSDRQLPEGGYEVKGFATAFSVPGRFRTAIKSKVSWLIGD